MTKHILVVDDDAASCELLREIFMGAAGRSLRQRRRKPPGYALLDSLLT